MGRIIRSRIDALQEAATRRREKLPGAARMAVRILNGGSMPTAVPGYFIGQPVGFTGDECEGCSSSRDDIGDPMPVLVLGPRVPSVGDVLIATQAGGRWVAESGKGSGGGVTTCGTLCASLGIRLLLSAGTVTDGLNTNALFYGKSLRFPSQSDVVTIDGPGICRRGTRDAKYRYGFGCDVPVEQTGKIAVGMGVPTYNCYDSMAIQPCGPTYFPSAIDFNIPDGAHPECSPVTGTATQYVTPTILSDRITFDVTFTRPGSWPYWINLPTTHAHFEIPIARPDSEAVCCGPLQIPKKNLTATIFGTAYTLRWNGSNLWITDCQRGCTSDYRSWTFQIGCTAGTISGGFWVWAEPLGIPPPPPCSPGGGGSAYSFPSSSYQIIDYTARPFHLHIRSVPTTTFGPTTCTQGTDIYVDE